MLEKLENPAKKVLKLFVQKSTAPSITYLCNIIVTLNINIHLSISIQIYHIFVQHHPQHQSFSKNWLFRNNTFYLTVDLGPICQMKIRKKYLRGANEYYGCCLGSITEKISAAARIYDLPRPETRLRSKMIFHPCIQRLVDR